MSWLDPFAIIVFVFLGACAVFFIWMAFDLRPLPRMPPLTWSDIEYRKRMEFETSMRAYRDAKRNVEAESAPDHRSE